MFVDVREDNAAVDRDFDLPIGMSVFRDQVAV